jgi:hypothetical protein
MVNEDVAMLTSGARTLAETVACGEDRAARRAYPDRRRRHELLAVAVCDRRNRVRTVRPIADGATDGYPLPVRDIIATLLRHDGHKFAIATITQRPAPNRDTPTQD